jgi:NADH dehydrogenase
LTSLAILLGGWERLGDRAGSLVVGDLVALDQLPGVGGIAMRSGVHAARTIARRLRGEAAEPFRYRDLGSMATNSRFRAVVTFGPIRLSGLIGWLAWLLVHRAFLTGFQNRVATMASWAVAFIGRGRPERAITVHQALGPAAPAPRQLLTEERLT